jgi:hypothetical protein
MREPCNGWEYDESGDYPGATLELPMKLRFWVRYSRVRGAWLADSSILVSDQHPTRAAAMLAAEDHARAELERALAVLNGNNDHE